MMCDAHDLGFMLRVIAIKKKLFWEKYKID